MSIDNYEPEIEEPLMVEESEDSSGPVDIIKDFSLYEKTILSFIEERKDTYFASDCYKKLKRRYERLRDSIDQNFDANKQNTLASKIAFSKTRPIYLRRRAITQNAFRSDPLITVQAIGDTDEQNAKNLQDVVSHNLKITKFRSKTFDRLIDSVARCGATVCYTQFQPNYRKGFKTTYDQKQMVPYQRSPVEDVADMVVENFPIHVLNYFQDQDESDAEQSSFRGFIDHWRMSDLINCAKNEPGNYIKENIDAIVKTGKGEYVDANRYLDSKDKKSDYSKLGADVVRIWTTLPIDGNEDDDTIYYVEIVGDKIIRCQISPYDEDIIPLTVGVFRARPEYWWGNTDVEDVLSHENYYNLMMQISADAAMKSMDMMTFYPRGLIDVDDMDNRKDLGGMIPYDLKDMPIQQALHTWQPRYDLGNFDYVMRELKESASSQTIATDLSRGFNQGGLNNSTATAAAIMQQQGDVLENDMLWKFSEMVIEIGRKISIMLIQFGPDEFMLRNDSKQPVKKLSKYEIMGSFGYETMSSMQKSSVTEFMKMNEAINNLANLANATQTKVDFPYLLRKLVQSADIGDVDKIIPAPEVSPQAPPEPQQAPQAAPMMAQAPQASAMPSNPQDMAAMMQGAIA